MQQFSGGGATIPVTHHIPNVEKPEEFNRIVIDFLKELVPVKQIFTSGRRFLSLRESRPSLSVSLSSGGPFIILEMVSPSALRHAIPVVDIIRAAQGCEKTNIARTLFAGRCSSPPKTSSPTASLLPTCPGGVGIHLYAKERHNGDDEERRHQIQRSVHSNRGK